ncbi:hypothetical protein B0T25DRAFT_361450 [Lasiosphaeria hispida]|uniref:Uncharacterized protein n=1 Tax=Lasiosphaeria hispida TaxID=260671 RepID=A0AAJ0H4W4_9PEZI|nr:hypothetical protein B0T25DRAFT_361450 [Lasiosphaeria hispida]
MLRVAIKKESAIDSYLKLWYQDLQHDFLSPQDWETLHLILSFLKPFFHVTKATKGDLATIDQVLFNMDILIQHFKKSLSTFSSNSFFSSQI